MIPWSSLKCKHLINQKRLLRPICAHVKRHSDCKNWSVLVLADRNLSRVGLNLNFAPSSPFMNVIKRSFVKTVSFSRRKISEPKQVTESALFIPVPVKIPENQIDNIGEELAGKINKNDVLTLLNSFYKREPIKVIAEESGLNAKLFHQAFLSFRKYCIEVEALPVDLHVIFNDLLHNVGHIDNIFPYFLDHAKQVFPHLSCMEELNHISDIRDPAKGYPEARAINRKIVFHAGPTNSGKTYHALERFYSAKSGVYCSPLKLLAVEIFHKANKKGISCDLITGEERRTVNVDGSQGTHVACTVEMTSVTTPYEVAVIDEIQMVRDDSRGWAWTRALLGVVAQEVHICGEESTIDIIKAIVQLLDEEFEVRRYKRLTKLSLEQQALGSLQNVKPGDCIVCFSKKDIFNVSLSLEKLGIECAVIYGGLPPGTKLAQAQKFNDPSDSCKILVATDAIGMGLNLSISRVIFNTLMKPVTNEKGEKEMDYITTSQALQIGGRAGRYASDFEKGLITTIKQQDLPILRNIMARPVEPVTQVGLLPTGEQLELFSYYLPQATLSNLIDIFVSLSQLDESLYFMCQIDNLKFLADMIQHIPIPMKTRYTFCCAPINQKQPLVCTMFLKYARQYHRNEPMTFDWLYRNIGWPFSPPKNILELIHLEASFDVLDLYLWLSYRFQDLFPDGLVVKDMQEELDIIIEQGIHNIVRLLKASENGKISAITKTFEEDDDLLLKNNQLKQSTKKLVKLDETTTISDHLVAKGLLTQDMLSQLKKELGVSASKKSKKKKGH